jgi:hypothetical protein
MPSDTHIILISLIDWRFYSPIYRDMYLILTKDGDVCDVERLSLADGVLENARVSALIVSGGVLDEQGGLQGRAALVVLPAVEHHRRSVSHPATQTKSHSL